MIFRIFCASSPYEVFCIVLLKNKDDKKNSIVPNSSIFFLTLLSILLFLKTPNSLIAVALNMLSQWTFLHWKIKD